MAQAYAIFVSTWNKNETKTFGTIREAEKEWDKICANKYALKTDGGKNVVISNPRLGYLSNFYFTTHYQKSW